MGKLLHVNWPFMSAGYQWPDNSFRYVFNRPYSRYQPSLRAPRCCRVNISVTWSLRRQIAGFAVKFTCKHWTNIICDTVKWKLALRDL